MYKRSKILSTIALIILNAIYCYAQQVEVITTNEERTSYQGKNYLVVKSLTLKPGFTISAATSGSWYAKVHPNAVAPSAPSSDQNFVRNESVLVNGITTETQVRNLTVADKVTTFTYSDGIGRGIQNVQVAGSPNLNDQVQPSYFDEAGRKSRQYLPYTETTGTTGSFRSNALNNQVTFYNVPPAKVEGDSRGYSEVGFDNSPLNRVFETKAVGADWANKPVTQSFTFNDSSTPVQLWSVLNGLPQSTSIYPANTLTVTQGTDEDGNTARTYTDFLGRTIMKESLTPTPTQAGEWAQTYYVYDNYGKPLFIIPPQAASNLTPDKAFVNRWCFQYQYDEYQRTIGSKAPGVGWVYSIYDKWDRPVLTQDTIQRSNNTWSFVKYDLLNRPVVNGTFTTTDSRSTLTTILSTFSGRYEIRNSSAIGYSLNQTFPTGAIESNLLTIVYYDDYSFINNANWDFESNSYGFVSEQDFTGTIFNNVKGLVTGGKVRILNSNTWLNSVTRYDNRYRPLQTISENQFSKTDRTTIEYDDFTGKVLKTKLVHQKAAQTHVILERYTYDLAGRLLKTYHKMNNFNEVLLSELQYNELGQLTKKKLHVSSQSLQAVDYRYNIRGWMTNMNYTAPDAGDPVDYFGMEIAYNESQSSNDRKYSGLISGIRWRHDISNKDRVYNFGYSNGAFTSAAYKVDNAPNPQTGAYNETVSLYDKNGNINTLTRKGAKELFGVPTIDQLAYSYDGNQLTTVTDTAPGADGQRGFKDGNTQNNDYVYDANGNVTEDKNKGITITYNHLNMPVQITFADQTYLQYTYLASGDRLKEVFYNGQSHTREYAAGFVYIEGVAVQLAHSQGHMTPATGEYYYYLTDHLGSPRVVLQTLNDTHQSLATFETANAANEAGNFIYYDEAVKINSQLFDHTNQGSTYYSARLKGTTNERFGLTKTLSVMPGDLLNIEVYAKYLDTNPSNWTTALTNFMAAIAGGTAPAGTVVDGGAVGSTGGTTPSYIGLLNKSNETGNAPKAYLNYIVFDRDFNFLDGGFVRVTEAAKESGSDGAHERLSKDLTITEAGYVYLYLSNDNDTPVEVYFDDFKVVQTESPVVQINGFYPFGLPSYTWVREGEEETQAKFQGKEYESKSGWYDFHARQYDGALGRWFAVDPKGQFASPYVGMGNNPAMGVDPDGEFFFTILAAIFAPPLLPAAIGADIGMWTGGSMANGTMNPFKWDYSSGRTWGYMAAGTVVGAASGYVGGQIATSGMPFANTVGIASASYINSVGTAMYTGGRTDVSVSFGVASYNLTQNEWGYLGKKGNSKLENIGYTFGAMANLTDAVSIFSGGGQNISANSAKTSKEDWWGHHSLTDGDGKNTLVSVGPSSPVEVTNPATGNKYSVGQLYKNSIKSADLKWHSYFDDPGTWKVQLNNVSKSIVSKYSTARWDLILNSCTSHSAKALWLAGVPNLFGFHPHLLNAQLLIRQVGIYSSPYLSQMR